MLQPFCKCFLFLVSDISVMFAPTQNKLSAGTQLHEKNKIDTKCIRE